MAFQRIEMPWPERISPDADASHARVRSWVTHWGLMGSEQALERYDSYRLAELSARAYPKVQGRDLDLIGKLMSWFFPFDDGYDHLSPDTAQRVTERYIGILHRTIQPTRPVEAAFADWLAEARLGMSPEWQKRFAAHWTEDLNAHVQEITNRERGFPSRQEYTLMRRSSIGMEQCLDLIERVGGHELAPSVADDPQLILLRTVTCDVVMFVNDVFSADKEHEDGDCNNLVLILEHEGMSRREAIEHIQDLIDNHITNYLARSRDLLNSLTGGPEYNTTLLFLTGMEYWMRGNLDWSRSSARYPDIA